jgi:ubiquinone/menaquinone biosynthesis C-methylase UbiE
VTLFDVGADIYDWLTFQAVWRAHCASLADHFPAGARRVLDVGIGPGISGLALRDRLPAATIVGVDLSRRMLARARRRTEGAAIPLLRADVTRLPFPPATFDAVTGHSLLYLLPDPAAAVREIARVLRPGGRAVFLEPHADAPPTALLRLAGPARFRLSMVLWRLVSAAKVRFTAGSLAALLATHLQVPAVHPTLGGLGLLATATAT